MEFHLPQYIRSSLTHDTVAAINLIILQQGSSGARRFSGIAWQEL